MATSYINYVAALWNTIGAPLLIESFENYENFQNFQRILWSDSWLKILKIFIIFKIFNEKRRT